MDDILIIFAPLMLVFLLQYQYLIGHELIVFFMSRFTFKTIVDKMLDFFVEEMRHNIKALTPEEFPEIGARFCRRARTSIFANAIGAINGTHIRITYLVSKHDEYLDYKGFYSIQCRAIVNSKFLFNIVQYCSINDTRVGTL